MNSFDRKRLLKMYEKVDSIAKNGKLGFDDYKEYLDEIVNDGHFWIFQNMLARKYGFNDTGKISLVDAKSEKIYTTIRLQTNSDFQRDLKKLYDTSACYQIGKNVYTGTHSFLGQIYQQSEFGSNESILIDAVVAIKGEEIKSWGGLTYSLLEKYKEAIQFVTS